MKTYDDPRKIGIPHPYWRASQRNAVEKLLDIHLGDGGIVVVSAPTGIGKSALPTAVGAYDKVTVLVHNLGLLKQYRDVYGFDIVMGKPEYECAMPAKVKSWKSMYNVVPTAADCHFKDMNECAYANDCPYVIARNKALLSQRAACTYKYAALSEGIQMRTGMLVCDEGHEFYEELLSQAQFQMTDDEASDHKLDRFPLYQHGPGGNGDIIEGDNRKLVMRWFEKAIDKLGAFDLFLEMTPDGVRNKRVLDRLTSAMDLLRSDNPLFYRCNRPAESFDWRFEGRSAKITMQLRSLDVSERVRLLTEAKKTTVLMSATIGNPRPLMTQLGLNQFQYLSYPHPVPKDKRPVYDLGMERMTKQNLDAHPGLYAAQANVIASFIEREIDPEWRGIILTTSNYKIDRLREGLKRRLNGRVIIPTSKGLSAQIHDFMVDETPGVIMVATIQGWGSGLSLVGNIARYAIVAGVPYINPGDRFDQLRTSTQAGRNYAFWNAHCAVVQATGRVSRGEKEADGSYMLNVGAIADGSATSPIARQSYDPWYNESIVSWRK